MAKKWLTFWVGPSPPKMVIFGPILAQKWPKNDIFGPFLAKMVRNGEGRGLFGGFLAGLARREHGPRWAALEGGPDRSDRGKKSRSIAIFFARLGAFGPMRGPNGRVLVGFGGFGTSDSCSKSPQNPPNPTP